MRTTHRQWMLTAVLAVSFVHGAAHAADGGVKIKDLARFEAVRDFSIMGYGLVVGLAGSGDSQRNQATLQSVSNMLREFGVQVPQDGLAPRDVAAVLVTARLPGAVRAGDKLDVNVAAIGDSRSLAGGTLLMTPLLGADRSVYATAQGAMSVGGYRYDQNGNVAQKNHPTSGLIPEGAIAEKTLEPVLARADGSVDLVLDDPDYTTARRVSIAINEHFPGSKAAALEAGRVRINSGPLSGAALVDLVAGIEDLAVQPAAHARVVVNERTGTIVAGGDVWISPVSVTQGDIKVSITERLLVSQPRGAFVDTGEGIRTAIVPDTQLRVREPEAQSVNLPAGATIAQLGDALRAIKASSRDVIAILQGIKRAGALHAELVIQ